jgi:predicted HicB family RNase H-like nuclease
MTQARSTPKNGRRNLHVEVPEEFHRKVKMLCAMQGCTLKAYAVTALEEKVARDEENIAVPRK